ncbi:MAG: DUF6600 domain-containing protein [Bryobacteraceae bacterium]
MLDRVHLGVIFAAVLFASVDAHAQFKPAPQAYGQPSYSGPVQPDPYSNAQEGVDDPEASGDQQHGVARLSVTLGDVGIRRGDTSEVIAAVANAPLQRGDGVQTSRTGAAEIQIDGANVVRVAENSEIGFSDLQVGRVQMQLTAGSALYRVLRPSDVSAEVDTPSIAVRPLGVSAIRITLLDGGVSRVTVYTGSAEMVGPQGTEPLQAGRTVLARIGPSGPEFQETGSIPQDQFDSWSSSRDGELLNSPSAQIIGPDVSGTADLDRNGSWVPSQYGQVWEPRGVGPEWAPYSNGQWAWEGYYGWTWVDDSPWGWAPYHYGRWFRNGSYGWCWWPGSRGVIRVWRPALVGFFGSGRGLGWVALAPHESFQAWWGRKSWIGGNRYGTGAARFQNTAFRGAALIAQRDNFSGPHQRFGWATPEQLRTASRFDGQVPVTPTRSSYRFSDRTFVSNLPHVSSSTVGRRQSEFNVTPRSNYRASAPAGLANGWQRFGDPGSQRNEGGSFAAAPRNESGWHQFGRPPAPQPDLNRSSATRSYRSFETPGAPSQPAQGSLSGWRSFSTRPNAETWSARPGRSSADESRYSRPQQRYQQPAMQSAPRSAQPSSRESFHSSGGGGYSREPSHSTSTRTAGERGTGSGSRSTEGSGHSRR